MLKNKNITLLKRNRAIISFVLCSFGFILNYLAYYPGFISPDSLDQYTQALNLRFYDRHPPIMAALWSIFLRIYNGGVLMFVFQLLLFWTSIYILTLTFLKQSFTAVLLLFLLFCSPFIQNFVGNIWKDVELGFSWLLAVSVMLHVIYENRRLTKQESFVVLIFLSYGCWLRINALPGLIPLVSMWVYTSAFKETWSVPVKQVLFRTVLVSGVIILAQVALNLFVLKPHKTYPEYKLYAQDLSGIYFKTGKLYFPASILKHPGFDTTYIKTHYKYATFDHIWWNEDGKKILPELNAEQIKELQSYWLKAIRDYPGIYLKNRALGFLNFIRISESGNPFYVMYPYIHPNEFGLTFTPNKLSAIFINYVESRRDHIYMKPWFWLGLNCLLVFLAFLKPFLRIKMIVLTLSLSSLFYLLFQFLVFQVDTDFRYFYWNCIALSLASIVVTNELSKVIQLKIRSNKQSAKA